MTSNALIRPFLKLALFQELEIGRIAEIAGRAERMIYRPGDLILHGRGPADAAVLIVSGEAVIVGGAGYPHEAELVPEGTLLGEMAMFIETENSAVVVARTAVRALKISRAQMHAHMLEDPTLADHFAATISRRLAEFVDGVRQIERELSGALARTATTTFPRAVTEREGAAAGRD